jgi:hypothetical protein
MIAENWTVRLSIGCGADPWGDVRLDVSLINQIGIRNSPNLLASATQLPIRTSTIGEIKCLHVLEHIIKWESVLFEIIRVSDRNCNLELRFPVADGFKRPLLIAFLRLNLVEIKNAVLTRRNKAHAWIVDPILVSQVLSTNGFAVRITQNSWHSLPSWFVYGRKAKLLRTLFVNSPRIAVEWQLNAVKNIDHSYRKTDVKLRPRICTLQRQ